MGKKKKSAPAVPAFSPTEVWDNGRLAGKTYQSGGTTRTETYSDPAELQRQRDDQARTAQLQRQQDELLQRQMVEQRARDAELSRIREAQSTERALQAPIDAQRRQGISSYEQQISDFTPQLNVVDPNFQKEISDYGNAVANDANSEFQRQFEPVTRGLREESAKRFGSLNNTFYQDEMDRVGKLQTDAYKSMANDTVMRKQDLTDKYLGRKQSYLGNLRSNKSMLEQGLAGSQQALGQQMAALSAGTGQTGSTMQNLYQMVAGELDAYNNNSRAGFSNTTRASEGFNNWNINKYMAELDRYKSEQSNRSSWLSKLFGGAKALM